jgi:hypothetical protein
MPKVTLSCPDGHPIRGSFERVQGTALINGATDLGPGEALDLDYAGETKIDWDTQESIFDGLERLFECSEYDVWKESQLIKTPLEKEKE